jgi:hypothetical protein
MVIGVVVNATGMEESVTDKYYFMEDGTYGYLDEYAFVCDTTDWTIADWQEVESCLHSERAFVARGIANKYASN